MAGPSSNDNRESDLIREVVRPQKRRAARRAAFFVLLAVLAGASAGGVFWLLRTLPGPAAWAARHATEASETPEASTEGVVSSSAEETAEPTEPTEPSVTESEPSSTQAAEGPNDAFAYALDALDRRLQEAESRLAALSPTDPSDGPAGEAADARTVAQSFLVTVVSTIEQTDWMQNTTHLSVESWGIVVGVKENAFTVLLNRQDVDPSSTVTIRLGNHAFDAVTWLASDPLTGLAMLQVETDTAKLADTLKPAVLGSAQSVAPGDTVWCLGAPYGQSGACARGLISWSGVDTSQEDMNLPVLCTDIPRGTGSGVLLTREGTVIGWVKDLSVKGYENMMTAVGVWGYAEVTADLAAGRIPARLGIFAEAVPETVQKENGVPAGLYVNSVRPGSPAEEAGIMAGDILTAADGVPLTAMRDLMRLLSREAPGTVKTFTLMRWSREGYEEVTAEATLQ